MPTTRVQNDRAAATRDAILTAAERLFAENGVITVSNRQVSEAAGQGNNAAVGYHFGTKVDLVTAIVERHAAAVDRRRDEMVRACDGSSDIRSWVSCLVTPMTEHLESLGRPSWYARFGAQVITDPEMRRAVVDTASSAGSLQTAIAGLRRCTGDLPEGIRATRSSITRIVITHGCADFERYLADGDVHPAATWERCGRDLVDAIVGIWQAPVTELGTARS